MNKLNKIIYNIKRTYAINYITNNLGKVIEDNNKIICYVKRNKIKKKDYSYVIGCHGIENKKIATTYNLNKLIIYVIDGLKFKNNKVYIFGYNNCEIIIKNCNFELDLDIQTNGKCTLDNTNITAFSYLSIDANELTIKNMNAEQIKVISPKSNIDFYASNKIEVVDSNIYSNQKNKQVSISFTTNNELNFINSNINAKNVICESPSINLDEKSGLNASDTVTIKTNVSNTLRVKAPIVILNKKEIKNGKNLIEIKKITDTLTLKRLELINLLKKVKIQGENAKLDNVINYQNELDTQSIVKVLKK